MGIRGLAKLRPLKAEKCYQVRVIRIAGKRVAMAHRFLGIPPTLRCITFRMIGKEKEIKLRNIPGIVTGGRRRGGPHTCIEHR